MKPVILKSVLIIFCFLFILVETPWAHPHVFIVQSLKIVFNDKGLAGFNIRWEFDDMFSTMISDDLNKNGVLEKTEVTSIKEKAFSYIAEFNCSSN